MLKPMLVEYGRDLILQLPSKNIMSVKSEAIHSRLIVHTARLPTNRLLMRHPSCNPIHGWGKHSLNDDLSRLSPPMGAADSNPAWYDLTLSEHRECGNLAMRLNVMSR